MSDAVIRPDAGVRTATSADSEAIGAVQSVLWRAAYADLLDPEILEAMEPEQFAAIWEQALRNPPTGLHRVLLATAGDRVVGIAVIGPAQQGDEEQPTGEIALLGIVPAERRVGHGSRLLNAAVDTLRANDIAAVELWLPAGDEQTRTFLGAAGLEPDGAWRERAVDGGESEEAGRTVREVRLVAAITDEIAEEITEENTDEPSPGTDRR